MWAVLIMTVAGLTLMAGSLPAQWSAQGGYGSGDASSLMETPTGSFGDQPSIYYPYWHNYLDNLQREGGYYSVTGSYPGSMPVTSYYPASPSSDATSPQASSMYYNPSDYYSTYGGQSPSGQAYGTPQTYQAPAGQQYYQPPAAAPQQATAAPQSATGKKRRLSTKRQAAEAAQQQAYLQQQQAYAQQQAFQQQQAYQQQAYQQQAYQQQGYGQPGYQQQQPGGYYAGYQQQPAYGQMQQQATQLQQAAGQDPLSSDPMVRSAQQKAYERAVARQRAAELAAQQQAASQELQQAQQMLQAAQQKAVEQERRQAELREEYHKKALAEAYEGLRAAQQRYYELMGVSSESGPPAGGYQARAMPQGQLQPQPYPQTASAPAQAYPAPGQGYPAAGGQVLPAPAQGYPGTGVAPGTPMQIVPQQASPGGQATPLQVQPQQQAESSGGFWSTLKEIFSPPTTTSGPPQRSMFERNKSRWGDD
jgi:hypothetical protein